MRQQIAGAGNPKRRLDSGDPGSWTGQSLPRRPNPIGIGGGVRLERMVGRGRHPDPVEAEPLARDFYNVLVAFMRRIKCSPDETDGQSSVGTWETDGLSG